jgi:hypothetical protein
MPPSDEFPPLETSFIAGSPAWEAVVARPEIEPVSPKKWSLGPTPRRCRSSDASTEQLAWQAAGTAAAGRRAPHINLRDIQAYEIPLPPLEEQRRIVAEIDERLGAIDVLRAAIERAQRRGAALRRSVLERAFRGELVPQDPSDEPASALLDRIRAEREASST